MDFRYKWWALIGLSLLSFTAFLDYTIVTTALPSIQEALHASVLQLQWVTNIFNMILCMFMIIVGQLGDRIGHKSVFYFGFIIFAIAALGAGYSPNIETLIFFRAIQGFAAAIIFTIGVALLPYAFPPNEQTKAIGIFSAFNGAGLAMGPFIGGSLIALFDWRYIFWVNIPIILAGIACCSFSLQPINKDHEHPDIDWVGFILLAIGLGCLIYGLIYGEQIGWGNLSPWLMIVVGIAALTGLIIFELQTPHPLLDFTIFYRYETLLAILICIVAGLITSVLFFFDPLYLQIIREQAPFYVGLSLLLIPIVQVLISLILNILVQRFGILHLLFFGIITGLFAALCHAFFTPSISLLFVFFAFILMGYSWGIANAGTITAASINVPQQKLGGAIGTIFTFWNISGSVFLAIASVIFHWREHISIHTIIDSDHIVLSAAEQQSLHTLLANPERIRAFFANYPQANTQEMINAFTLSFMEGFHLVAWFSSLVMLGLLIIALWRRHYGRA